MATKISNLPEYSNTIYALEKLKHFSENGTEYWLAREIHTILGYPVWDKFKPVIGRAISSLRTNKIKPSHHIAETSNMMGLGKGANRKVRDLYLSRVACRLIAMNGDTDKVEIAAAQAYFVVQTHRAEEFDKMNNDEKRIEYREKITIAFKAVSSVAKEAGVPNKKQAIFHNARYEGLYGMSARQVKNKKGLSDKDNPFDFAGPLELSANEFQMNMAADVIKNENIKGENFVIKKNKAIAEDVRNTMKKNKIKLPENLPIEESIKSVKKRLEGKKLLNQ